MQETLLGRLIDLSPPQLASLGGACLYVAVGTICFALVSLVLRRRRLSLVLFVIASALVVAAAIAITDVFCIAGYVASDGSCAWE